MIAAIYARVSTLEQNPEAQLAALREYAERRNIQVQREYLDHITGDLILRRHSKRDQGFRELMAAAHLKLFDCVIVWKYDRFARSLSGLIEALQTFSSLGIDFISVTQAVDTTTPAGRLFYHMIGAFAEFERELIHERTRAGIAHAKTKGVRFGPPRNSILETRVALLREQGQSLRQIAGQVNRSPAGVLKILKRKVEGR